MKRPDLKKMLACAWTSASIGAVLTMAVGVIALLAESLEEPLTHLSYDSLFALRPNIPAHDVAIVYMDEASAKALQQPPGGAWDRKLHAQLLEKLTAEHAAAVVFDILFEGAGPVPASDARFIRAMKTHRRVLLASSALNDQHQSQVASGWLDLPYEPFR